MRVFFLFLVSVSIIYAKLPEKWYADRAAEQLNGQREVTMPDRTRCDIVTSTHAIEVDFARKWAEAIGQSLNYSFQTELKPGIVLILEKPSDRKYLIRLQSLLNYHKINIDLFPFEAWKEQGFNFSEQP